MRKSYIYNLAMNELYRQIEREEAKLKENPNSAIAPERIEILKERQKKLNALLLEVERIEAYAD